MSVVVSSPSATNIEMNPKDFPTADLSALIRKYIGEYIASIRNHENISLDAAVRSFNRIGGGSEKCSSMKWRGWEQGNYRPDRDDLITIARVLKQSPEKVTTDVNAIMREAHYMQGMIQIHTLPAQEVPPPPIPIRAQLQELPVISSDAISLEDEIEPEVIVTLRLAALIKRAKASSGFSNEEISELLNVPLKTLQQIQRGMVDLSADLIAGICTAFSVDPLSYQLQAGFLPDDIVMIIRRHPEIVADLRERFPN